MCNLLLPRDIKGFSAYSAFFSINNFNQKAFERRIKAMVSTNIYVNVSYLFFNSGVHHFDFAFCSWHITILFPVLHINI